MAKILINIPDEIWASIKHVEHTSYAERIILKATKNGTPLPKGHGDLKDIQDIINRINLNYNNHQSIDAYSLKDMIATVPTIIRADKAGDTDG